MNCICDCGYETGFINGRNFIKIIRNAGGEIKGNIKNNKLNVHSSICPACKAKNSFDVELKNVVFECKDFSFSSITRLQNK